MFNYAYLQGECNRLRGALAAQARASEERLTELHGVIAELRRAGAARDRAAIPELREDESGTIFITSFVFFIFYDIII